VGSGGWARNGWKECQSKKGAVSQGHSQPAAARLSPQTRLGPPLTGWRRKGGGGGGPGGCTEAKCVWCRCTPTRGSWIEDSRMMVNRSPSDAMLDVMAA
jgi:hypothetical protein